MTTDITELAQRMRTAAKKATPGQWVAFTHADSRTFSVHTPDDNRCGDVIKWAGFDGQRKAKANAEFIALANPANVLALVEALEKAQQRIASQREYYEGVIADGGKRIAELESRTVTVKLPELIVDKVCLTAAEIHAQGSGVNDDKAQEIIDRIREILTPAAGIKWEVE